jgi:REP element-mobilizing transposase RayT
MANGSRKNPQRKKPRAQRELSFGQHGGWRPGAGRKPNKKLSKRTPHRSRPELAARYPVHVSMRLRKGLRRSLRSGPCYRAIRKCLRAARDRLGCRIIHYSVQGNHIHMIVEARDEKALGRAMKGFCVRVAKRFNKLAGRRGQVFAKRYCAEYLRSLRQTRNALVYVLQNAKRHALEMLNLGPECLHRGWVDPCSSAAYFDGWKRGCRRWLPPPDSEPAVMSPEVWQLKVGWKRLGLIDTSEIPKAGRL